MGVESHLTYHPYMAAHSNNVQQILMGTQDDILSFLESNQESSTRLLEYLYNAHCMFHLDGVLLYPSTTRFFLRPPAHLQPQVAECVSRISSRHATFMACWRAARYSIDNNTLFAGEHAKYLKKEAGRKNVTRKPVVRWLGEEQVWVKVEDIDRDETPRRRADQWTADNELRFSQVSMALNLTNLSDGAIPFSATICTEEAVITTSVHCGMPVLDAKDNIRDIVYQSVMALWALRAYGEVLHLDCHLGNFVAQKTPSRNLVWAWSFDTGLDRPVSSSTDHITGFMLPKTNVRVTVIDGGWCSTTLFGRKRHKFVFRDRIRYAGWDNIDTSRSLRHIGLDLVHRTRDMEDDKPVFVPILYYADIPDAVVDLVSFFVCMYIRGKTTEDQVTRENCLEILGCIVRIAKQDPGFGHESVVELMVRINGLIGGLVFVDGARQKNYEVIPMPAPGKQTQVLVTDTINLIES